jgi:hypothetical protein
MATGARRVCATATATSQLLTRKNAVAAISVTVAVSSRLELARNPPAASAASAVTCTVTTRTAALNKVRNTVGRLRLSSTHWAAAPVAATSMASSGPSTTSVTKSVT